MDNKEWKYKIAGNLQGLIPALFLLAVFGGLSIWLYKIDNAAYIFTTIFTAFTVAILAAVFYRALFIKVLIYDDGFYRQTKPGKGRYYKYSEIKKAWVSSGKSVSGDKNFFCNYMTYDGQVVKFPFFLAESDSVDYLIECVENKSPAVYDDNINHEIEEYKIDGKHYGITYIIISVIIFAVFSIFVIPTLINEVSANRWFGVLFSATGLLLPLSIVIRLVVRYFFHKVNIESNRFYVQTNPFNGKYYKYADIKSCTEVLRVAQHGTQSEGASRSYYYFFIFTDITGRKRKFQFQKDIHGHEIDVLKERIALCNNCEVTQEVNPGDRTVIYILIRIIAFILIMGIVFLFGHLSNKHKAPSPKPSQNKTEVTQKAAPDFTDVNTALSKRGFETANIPTTYWFIEEDKLANVVSGIKENTAFEFYEYTDGETINLIFNQISYEISKNMEPDERDKHITELPDGNKIFTLTENGIYSVVIYKENTLVYAHSSDTSNEIQDILIELEYMKKQ